MDRQQFRNVLEARLSALLRDIPRIPQADRSAIQDYIDNNEYGLALDLLIDLLVDLGLLLQDCQYRELSEVVDLMGAPDSVLQPLKHAINSPL
jgi:hypothetical protein